MTVCKKRVEKVVMPVAGLHTRRLTVTNAVTKETLATLGKPTIQYAVEKYRASGIEEIIFATALGENAMRAHFKRDVRLENILMKRGKKEEAKQIRELSWLAKLRFIVQEEPLGMSHAVQRTEQAVGAEPYAPLLSDVHTAGPHPGIGQLVEIFTEHGAPVVTVEHVCQERISQCGIVDVDGLGREGRLFRIRKVIRKLRPKAAPPDLGIIGR